MKQAGQRIPDGTYVELVASLFATRSPTLIMSMLFAGIGATAVRLAGDAWLAGLFGAGLIGSAVRVAVLLHDRSLVRRAAPSAAHIHLIERRFAASYLLFAAILGLFGARVLMLPRVDLHMLVVVMLVGYAAGVAAGVSLRPWIALPSILLAEVPAAGVALVQPDPVYALLALSLIAFTAGGFRSMITRYRGEHAGITARRRFAELARHDHLTALPNRLALAEHFAALPIEEGSLALHCLDLDRFKPVNDRLGHAAGDAVLVAVAERLRDLVRGEDMVARIGGDEFVLVQAGIRHPREADAMARRIERELALPYVIAGETVIVGASIGTALHRTDELLDALIARADEALRTSKGERRPASAASRLHLVG